MEVLIVDDSNVIRSILKSSIENTVNIPVHTASTMSEAEDVLAKNKKNIDIAIVDLNLVDAPDGEIIDYIQQQGIPAIVLTPTYSQEVRESILNKHVIDFVVKSNLDELQYVVSLIQRLNENPQTNILVVNDDKDTGDYLRTLLKCQRYNVDLAFSDKEAISLLEKKPEIDLMIVDYQMSEMDGVELVLLARALRNRDELSIVGFSSNSSASKSVVPRLLKAGADDFLSRPFTFEEFNCRINQNIDALKLNKQLKDSSVRDHLTGLYNRKFLFETGKGLHANAKRGNGSLSAAMIDIDHFKNINERYSQYAGDLVIKHIAATIAESVRQSDIVARIGGEEFCILLNDANPENLYQIIDEIRSKIENTRVISDKAEIRFTISCGITNNLNDSLDKMIQAADELLNMAKQNGRNNVQSDII